MKRLLKESRLHFLLLGALLFAGYGVLNRGGIGSVAMFWVIQRIVVF